ncbi:hypothetical protein [Paenibacillus spongiae]|uniref:Uncharacterized protein n=1 Tax=Paenibacillus spongiae TaxID=2909671 RepID=A0ABY5SBV9_9BACL|nr:hypothetical protein [Paenibacillus spongiae]UVI31010.1 hypothetical protein L1F29_03855 [Paenibacillus spongiae]
MSKLKYMEACFAGEALQEEIEDYIEEWHESNSTEEVYEYLGMTEEEYAIWVENDSMLRTIFHARKLGISINEFIGRNNAESLVARSASPEEAASIKEWLARTGRIQK